MAANEFCFNCGFTLSKHEAIYWSESYIIHHYNCPCDITGKEFYSAVTYVPMTNLEFLERVAHD